MPSSLLLTLLLVSSWCRKVCDLCVYVCVCAWSPSGAMPNLIGPPWAISNCNWNEPFPCILAIYNVQKLMGWSLQDNMWPVKPLSRKASASSWLTIEIAKLLNLVPKGEVNKALNLSGNPPWPDGDKSCVLDLLEQKEHGQESRYGWSPPMRDPTLQMPDLGSECSFGPGIFM